MSILQQTQNVVTEQQRLQNRVREIKNAPARLTEHMFIEWNRAFDSLWNNDGFTVEQKLSALGTDAKELFELNTAFTTFMLGQLSGKRDDLVVKIAQKIATIPAFTIKPNNTVVLD